MARDKHGLDYDPEWLQSRGNRAPRPYMLPRIHQRRRISPFFRGVLTTLAIVLGTVAAGVFYYGCLVLAGGGW